VPAGWYVDPGRCHQFRYWDGRRWTPGVADSGFVREDPLPEQPCASEAGPPTDTRARPPLRATAIGLAGLVGGALLSIGVALAFRRWAPDAHALGLALAQAALWTGMFGAIVLVSRRYGTGSIGRDFGLRFGFVDVGWGLLLAIVARILTIVVVVLLVGLSGHRPSGGGLGTKPLETPELVLMCLFLVVGAPLVEELFFRGLLLRSLQTRLRIEVAVPIQATLFAAAHALSNVGIVLVAQLISTLLFGLGAGFVVHHFRRLGPSMVGHALFNAVVAVVLVVIST
jgi:membrane protease YdiL (CAAX protease family)